MYSDAIISEISKVDSSLFDFLGPNGFATLGHPDIQPSHYKGINHALLQAYKILQSRNRVGASLYVKFLISKLIENFRLSEARVALPLSVQALYSQELARITEQLLSNNIEYYNFNVDPFAKDFAFLTHRLIPVGAEFAEPNTSVYKRPLLANGIKSALAGLNLLLIRARGLEPFFCLHAHPMALQDFNPQGWIETYHRLADLLKANPNAKGITSASWFLDPQLREISPHLSYLRDVPEEGGAMFFRSGIDQLGDSGALARSAKRRALFDQGRYIPVIYMRVWIREDLLRWSRLNPVVQKSS